MNILVVEDDPVIRRSVEQGLQEAGHVCRALRDGEKGMETISEINPDLVLLDILLPGRSGLELLREIRAHGYQMPVIILTALGSVEERVHGLSLGADDYVVKPFAFSELMARVEAVARRSLLKPPSSLKVGDLSLDLTTRRVTTGDQVIELTPTEFSILEQLMRFAGQVVTRKMLCEHVWGFTWEGNTNVIEVHVNRLRQKLDRGHDPSLIHTVRGRGYAIRSN